MKFTTHRGDPRTVIQVSLTAIFTTNIVCSHLDGVLKDCVRLDVSQRRLAWRVGVGGNGFFVLSVGGGVRDRGRCWAAGTRRLRRWALSLLLSLKASREISRK